MTEPTIVPFPPASHPASPNSLAAVQALCKSGQTIQARRMVNLVACMLSGRQLPRVVVRMVADAGRSVAARLKFDRAGVCARISPAHGYGALRFDVAITADAIASALSPCEARDLAYALLVAADSSEQLVTQMQAGERDANATQRRAA